MFVSRLPFLSHAIIISQSLNDSSPGIEPRINTLASFLAIGGNPIFKFIMLFRLIKRPAHGTKGGYFVIIFSLIYRHKGTIRQGMDASHPDSLRKIS